jgi:hypothetical protein
MYSLGGKGVLWFIQSNYSAMLLYATRPPASYASTFVVSSRPFSVLTTTGCCFSFLLLTKNPFAFSRKKNGGVLPYAPE